MEQYWMPKKLDFKNLRSCLDNYSVDFLYIRLVGSAGGMVKVNENIRNKKLDFRKNKDFVKALAKVGIKAKDYSIKRWGDKRIKPGTIVFSKRSKLYPTGHFLLKTKNGWMSPWKTGDTVKEAKAGWQRRFPGTKEWIIETSELPRAYARGFAVES